MPDVLKPLPDITPANRPYWEGAREHKLSLLHCAACGAYRHPLYGGDTFMCSNCGTMEKPLWVEASGRGKINTWTVVHRVFHLGFAPEVPYIVAIVDLDEGARMLANVRGVRPEDVTANMAVEVIFEQLTEEITLPQFRPVIAQPN